MFGGYYRTTVLTLSQQQSRMKQNQQQELLRQMRPDMTQQQYQAQMMRNMQQNGTMAMSLKQNNLARAAMANNQNKLVTSLTAFPYAC